MVLLGFPRRRGSLDLQWWYRPWSETLLSRRETPADNLFHAWQNQNTFLCEIFPPQNLSKYYYQNIRYLCLLNRIRSRGWRHAHEKTERFFNNGLSKMRRQSTLKFLRYLLNLWLYIIISSIQERYKYCFILLYNDLFTIILEYLILFVAIIFHFWGKSIKNHFYGIMILK